jgi:hypothetical protein
MPAPGQWTSPDTIADPTPSPTPDPFPSGGGPTAPPPGSYSATNGSRYFIGAYLPTLVAILMSIWWKSIYARLKVMKPIYQMTMSGGAEAKDFLLLSYPRAALPIVLFQGFFSKHRLSFLGSLNTCLITVCTLFASETLFITTEGSSCRLIDDTDSDSDTNNDCHMLLALRPPLAWALGAVLIAITASTAFTIVQLRRQVSGIFNDPTTIAGVACLCNEDLAQVTKESLQNDPRRFAFGLSYQTELTPFIEATPALNRSEKTETTQRPSARKHSNGGVSNASWRPYHFRAIHDRHRRPCLLVSLCQ